MNTHSLEQQLQETTPPLPDPAARLRAKRAALTEFRRLHAQSGTKPVASRWSWKSPWLGGFATAGIAVVGVSLYWLAPENERRIQLPSVVAPVTPAPGTRQETERQDEVAPLHTPVPVTAPVAQRASGSEPAARTGSATPVNTAGTVNISGPASASVMREGNELSEVAVTGARVYTSGASAVNPVPRISAEEMRQLGILNVADSLTKTSPGNISTYAPGSPPPPGPPAPPVYGPPAPLAPVAAASDPRSASFVGNTIGNLRGQDPGFGSRTLTLVDGSRVVSTTNQAGVAIATVLPSNLQQRLEPMATGDKFEHFDINPVKRVTDEPESTFSIDVDTASYSFSRRVLNQGQLPQMDAVRVEEMINYFDYAWPAPTSRQEPLRPTVAVSNSPWGEGKKLVHIGIKGYELPAKGKPDVNLVLLLDVSGSMNSPDKLPLAKQSMALLLDSLKPTDTVAIVVYAGAAGQVLAPTPVRNRDTIERALNSLQPGGSTAGAQGIRLAYELAQASFREGGINRILLATDGDFNVGISSRDELKGLVERERVKGIYLSVLGFGQGNYRDETAQTLAQNGNGVAAYIDTLQEARKVLVQEATSSLFTIASDVKIQVEFNPAAVAEYRLVGYETRALNREDFNNDKVDAGDVGSGHSVTAIYEITPVGSGAQLIDDRRYSSVEKSAGNSSGKSNEYGFLKIRYKLPGESQSRLMQQPIRQDTGIPAAVRQDVAFSTAVAGFGQLLRGGRYTGALSYEDIVRQAAAAAGKDEYGYRAEFVQLARKARDARSPLCGVIEDLDVRIGVERQQASQLLGRLTDQHPDVLAARARVASTEATRAAEVARAASLGLTCRVDGQRLF